MTIQPTKFEKKIQLLRTVFIIAFALILTPSVLNSSS